MKTPILSLAVLTICLFAKATFGQGGIILKDSPGTSGSGRRSTGSSSSSRGPSTGRNDRLGGGLFGMEPASTTVSPRGSVAPIIPLSTGGRPATRRQPTTRNTGTLEVSQVFTVRQWNPGFYNREIRASQTRINQINRIVDQLRDQYNANRTVQNREVLIGWLNRLRDERNRLANNKRIWNAPLEATFNSNSIPYKKQLVERALQLGFAGKSIKFGNNRDGSMRIIVWDGKPNYSQAHDVTHQFR